MLKTRPFPAVAATILAVYLWTRGVSRAGGFSGVLEFAAAGIVSAIALTWICRSFASVPFTRRTAALSTAAGFFVLTPFIYMMLTGYTDKTGSVVILATTAAATAAMAGALWSVSHLVRNSFSEWRKGGLAQTQ